MRVDNCYILLWRGVLIQLISDIVGINEKPKYRVGVMFKAFKYWRNERDEFLMVCDLAGVNSDYMDFLLQEIYDNKEEIANFEKTGFAKFLKVFFKKLEVKW